MIDIELIRNDRDAVKENIKKKFQDAKLPLVDEVYDLDRKFRDDQRQKVTIYAVKKIRLREK